MTSIDNETRAERARAAMAAYEEAHEDYDEDDAPVSDLLADLMHLVGPQEFAAAYDMAQIHYHAELKGE
jgi:hypothetical protein